MAHRQSSLSVQFHSISASVCGVSFVTRHSRGRLLPTTRMDGRGTCRGSDGAQMIKKTRVKCDIDLREIITGIDRLEQLSVAATATAPPIDSDQLPPPTQNQERSPRDLGGRREGVE